MRPAPVPPLGGTPMVGAARQVTTSMAGTVVARVSGALGALVVARLLGPEGKGEYALVVFIATFCGLFVSGGLGHWATKEIANGEQLRWVRSTLRLQAAIALGTASGAVVLTTIWRPADPQIVFVVAAYAFAVSITSLVFSVPIGMGRAGSVGAASASGGAVYVVSLGLLRHFDVLTVESAVLAAGACLLLSAALLGRSWRSIGRAPTSRRRHLKALRFGAPAMGGEVLILLMFRVDIAILAIWVSTADVGRYTVALGLTELIWVVADGVAYLLLSRRGASLDRLQVARIVRSATAGMTVIALVLGIIADPVIGFLFGDHFRAASSVLWPLAIAATCLGLWKMVAGHLISSGYSAVRLHSTIVGFVAIVALNLALIPHFGLMGAAWASAVAYGLTAAVVVTKWLSVSALNLTVLVPRPQDLETLVSHFVTRSR